MPVRPDPSERTVPALLVRNAERDAGATLIIDERGPLTHGDAVEVALGMAHALSDIGIARGDTVALMLDNRRELIATWFGLAAMGAVEVPLNPELFGDRLVHALNHAECRVLVVLGDRIPQVDAVADRLTHLQRLVVVGEGASDHFEVVHWTDLEVDARGGRFAAVDYSDLSAIMYTSGSTGPAKGVMISHGQHFTNGWQPTSLFGLGPADTVYTCLPLYHNMAQGYGVLVALVSGGSVRIAPRFKADQFWPDVRESGATVLSFVGAMLVLLAKRPESPDDADNPLRYGFGVPIPRDLHETFERRFGLELVHVYGSTEQTCIAWNVGPDRVIGAAGRVLDDFEVQIVDDRDQPVPPGELGEICSRPREPYVMFTGYWRDAERTVAAFRNLWYHSGDRGRLDADGTLWFSDRMGDVIRRRGEFISSQQVEQVIGSHPQVEIAAAYGVPSELTEEEVMVAVVPRGEPPTADALRVWCAERLERHAVPRYVRFVDALPLTPTGKIEKYKLKQEGVTESTDDARATKHERT